MQNVLTDNTLLLVTTYQSRSCCRDRELCGFVHGDDFIITGDSMQLAQRNLDGANVSSVLTPAVETGVDAAGAREDQQRPNVDIQECDTWTASRHFTSVATAWISHTKVSAHPVWRVVVGHEFLRVLWIRFHRADG